MLDVTLRGTYSAKFSFNLFGRRISLGSKRGLLDTTLHILDGLSCRRRHDFGPVEAFANLEDHSLELGLTASDGLVPLWSQKWSLKDLIGVRRTKIAFDLRGVKIDALLTVQESA